MDDKLVAKLRVTAEKAAKMWMDDSHTDNYGNRFRRVEKVVFDSLDKCISNAMQQIIGIEISFGEVRVRNGSKLWQRIEAAANTWLDKHPNLFADVVLTPKEIKGVNKAYRDSLVEAASELAMERGKRDAIAMVNKVLGEVKADLGEPEPHNEDED